MLNNKPNVCVTYVSDDAFNNTTLVAIVPCHHQDATVLRPHQSRPKHYC